MSRLVATFFYVGLLRPAPGTWGSAATIPLAWGLHWLGGFPLVAAATVAVALAGYWATRIEVVRLADPDPSQIVIDEVAGQLIALWPLSAGLWWTGVDPWVFPWPGWVTAFVFFRFFDILKPGPIGWADRRHDPLGVMLDDVIAGLFAALVVTLAATLGHHAADLWEYLLWIT